MGAKVKLTVQTNFDEASKELRKFGTLTEQETKRIDTALKRIKTDQLDAFVEKNKRAGVAITATRGRLAGLKSENLALQRKMEMLIRNGIDPQDKALQKLKAEYVATGEQIKKMEKAQEDANKAMEAGKNIAGALVTALIAVSAYGTKAFADYAKEIANVSTLIEMTASDTQMLDDAVSELSNTYAIQKQELGAGVYQAVSAGASDLSEALVIVEQSARLGRSALIENAQAVDIITTAMNAYGEEVVDAEHASNIYFQTIKKGKINGEQLAGTIGQSITLFASANLAIEDLGAGISTLTKVGVKASEATTQLNAVVNGFIKPSEAMSDALARAGYESGSALLETRGLAGAMEFLETATGGSNERLATLLPNIRGMRGAMALMSEDGEVLAEVMNDFNDVSTATTDALAQQTDGFAKDVFTVERSIIALQNLAMEIGEKVLPVIGKLAEFVVTLSTDFNSLPAPTKALIRILGNLAVVFGSMMIISNISILIPILVTKMGLLSVAAKALWVVLSANPILAIVAGLSALGLAITHNITDNMNDASDAIGRWATAGADDYRSMSAMMNEYNTIRSKDWGDRTREERRRMGDLEDQIEDLTGATLRYGEVQQTIRGVTETVTEAYLDQGQGFHQTADKYAYLAEVYETGEARRAQATADALAIQEQAENERARLAEEAIQAEEARVAREAQLAQLRLENAQKASVLREELLYAQARMGKSALEIELYNIEENYQSQRQLMIDHYGASSELLQVLESQRAEAIREAREAETDEEIQTLRERISTTAVLEREARDQILSDLSTYYQTVSAMGGESYAEQLAELQLHLEGVNELQNTTDAERLIAKQAIEDQITEIERLAEEERKNIALERFSRIKQTISMAQQMAGALSNISANKTAREIADAKATIKNEEELEKKIAEIEARDLKRRQKIAVVDKALAIASVAINTARGIAEVLPNIPLAIAVGAIGLAQGVAVASTPIPSAETGGKFEASMEGTQRTDGTTVSINPGETLEVTPRSEDSSKSVTVINKFDEQVFWESTQRGVDAGFITFTTDNLVGA